MDLSFSLPELHEALQQMTNKQNTVEVQKELCSMLEPTNDR